MKKNIFVLVLIFASLLTASIPIKAAETESEPEEAQSFCQKPVKTPGPGNTLASIAQLKTIIIWSDIVTTKYGTDFSQWHQAQSKNIKCTKASGSRYYYCEINAMPCAQKTIKEIDELKKLEELAKQKKEKEKEKEKEQTSQAKKSE